LFLCHLQLRPAGYLWGPRPERPLRALHHLLLRTGWSSNPAAPHADIRVPE